MLFIKRRPGKDDSPRPDAFISGPGGESIQAKEGEIDTRFEVQYNPDRRVMSTCTSCGLISRLISDGIGACVSCIKTGDSEALEAAQDAHRRQRREFGLPEDAPRDKDGVTCDLCVRMCRIGEGNVGYCGIRKNTDGVLKGGDAERGKVLAYHDALPTNCVASWVCPAGTGCGYPEYSYKKGPEFDYTNLAVFYEACSFDCLFCQNWSYRRGSTPEGGSTPEKLADAVDSRTACICYFGGDPGPQARHAIAASRIARKNNPDRPLRICWETNGSVNPEFLDDWLDLSILKSHQNEQLASMKSRANFIRFIRSETARPRRSFWLFASTKNLALKARDRLKHLLREGTADEVLCEGAVPMEPWHIPGPIARPM